MVGFLQEKEVEISRVGKGGVGKDWVREHQKRLKKGKWEDAFVAIASNAEAAQTVSCQRKKKG